MQCPRLDHFVRFNPNGTVSRCGHMVNPAQFDSLEQMESSVWLRKIREQFENDQWPNECQRCEETEQENNTSIRLNSINFNQQQTQSDYLIVGGVLDNICNSGCLTCNEQLSTKIGSLTSKHYPIVDNTNRFWDLPQERIVHLDLNGGEPSHSRNYKQVLANLPKNVKSVRLNTNCSTVLEELIPLVERGVDVTVTVSLDGIGPTHDFVRWPIKWDKFYSNLMTYKNMPVKLNLWTTVSILNVDDLPNIIKFAQDHGIDHSYAYLKQPAELSIEYPNREAQQAYIQKQKQMRGME
jgi:sulfatase maturation enzyme AslB (radical SAM superfamily)